MNSSCASHDPAEADDLALARADGSAPEPGRRFSPLAALIVLTLLSLGSWAAIWAAVASLVPG